MILDQGQRTNCGIYSCMAILQHMWIVFDVATFSELKAPYIPLIEKVFVDSGLIKQFVKLPTAKLVDLWIKRGEYILTGTPRGDFTLDNNIWWLVEFDENAQHWFVIVEDCGDTWKCQNSWWPLWNWDWCFYIQKSDFTRLFCPRRIVANIQKSI